MTLLQIVLLATVQGLAELLPISSSAHVIVSEKLMGLDPTAPAFTFFLVMLHLGTMFAVLAYFRRRWIERLRGRDASLFIAPVIIGTMTTGVVGLALKHLLEKVVLPRFGHTGMEVEQLFGSVPLISGALASAGVLIVLAGRFEWHVKESTVRRPLSVVIGAVQGLCLPFRGFSRSGATISTALLARVDRGLAEDLSFALAVALTPPVIYLELRRYLRAAGGLTEVHFGPAALGMVASFLAGLVALRWLSSWLERGRWSYFGYYCLVASAVLAALHLRGVV
jgi:undecaprenyl-diphosphatase